MFVKRVGRLESIFRHPVKAMRNEPLTTSVHTWGEPLFAHVARTAKRPVQTRRSTPQQDGKNQEDPRATRFEFQEWRHDHVDEPPQASRNRCCL